MSKNIQKNTFKPFQTIKSTRLYVLVRDILHRVYVLCVDTISYQHTSRFPVRPKTLGCHRHRLQPSIDPFTIAVAFIGVSICEESQVRYTSLSFSIWNSFVRIYAIQTAVTSSYLKSRVLYLSRPVPSLVSSNPITFCIDFTVNLKLGFIVDLILLYIWFSTSTVAGFTIDLVLPMFIL